MHQPTHEGAASAKAGGSRESAPTGASGGGHAVQLKESLRGMGSLGAQLAALAPPDMGPVPVGGGGGPAAAPMVNGAPVQMKIDIGTLNSKFESDKNYGGTIDTDSTCEQANAVGEEWVGSGSRREAYGEPFKYRLYSGDGKRAYRPPMQKQSGKMVGNAQANFEGRAGDGKRYTFNAHVTVTDIDKHMSATGGETTGSTDKKDEAK